MMTMRCALAAALLMLVAGCSTAGVASPEEFQARLDRTWMEISDLVRRGSKKEAEQLQRTRSEECWNYYLADTNTETGENALVAAFKMWRNLGDRERIDRALAEIDTGARVWYRVLPAVRGAYLKDGKRDEYLSLFERLSADLGHPVARAQALQSLASDHALAGDAERAADLYRKIVELDADRVYTVGARKELREIEVLAVGRPAPEFETLDIDGKRFSLGELKGKVVVLEFWATWCPPCIPEIEHLERLRAEYTSDDLEIVAVSFDGDLAVLREFVARRGLHWHQLCDQQAGKGKLAQQYNVEQLPRSFVIDRAGLIAAKDHRRDALDQVLRDLIGPGPGLKASRAGS